MIAGICVIAILESFKGLYNLLIKNKNVASIILCYVFLEGLPLP